MNLRNTLRLGIHQHDFGEEINKIINENEMNRVYSVKEFISTCIQQTRGSYKKVS